MLKPNAHPKRLIITIGVVFVVAVIGLVSLNTAPVTAGQSLSGTTNQLTESSEAGATAGEVKGSSRGITPASAMSATGSIVKMVSALVVVVICIYGAVFALKKLMGRKITGRGSQGVLEVLETAHLGPKKMISVVRVADRSVLIGVTENQISLLSELDEEKTAMMTVEDEQPVVSNSFGDMLKSATTRVKELGTRKPEAVLAEK